MCDRLIVLSALLCFVYGCGRKAPATATPPAATQPARITSVGKFDKDYRYVHKTATKAAEAGNFPRVRQWCELALKNNKDDLEALWLLAIAQANLGEDAKALQTMQKAVGLGLPAGRFLAGPRGWVKPITEGPAYAKFRETLDKALVHGPMLGDLRPEGVKVWARTARPAEVRVKMGDREVSARTSAQSDHTAVVDILGLSPQTEYRYEVLVDGAPAGGGSFRTPQPVGEKGRFVTAFGACAGYIPMHERMWDLIAGYKPDVFLTLGDNVYIDEPKSPDHQRYQYYRRQSRPEYRRLIANSAVYAIWDDHDFGANDASGGPEIDKPEWKRQVFEVFRQNWANPAYAGGDQRPGCWFKFSRGDVDFFFMDGRYYRQNSSKVPKSQHTMLGPVQKQWLLESLKASRAAFKVVVSPVTWLGDGDDKWDGFPLEREEIFSFIGSEKIEGVLLLTGDRHRTDILLHPRPGAYDLYEFENAKLTNVHTNEVNKNALFSYSKKCMFGRLAFDTTAPDPTITYDVINIDDEKLHTLTLRRSQLSFGR